MGFVLGTYHFAQIEDLPDYVLDALKKAPIFVSERDFNRKVSQPPAADESGGAKSVGVLSLETMEKMTARGLPRQSLAKIPRPSLCIAYLFWESYQRLIASGGTLDSQLAALAMAEKKELIGLQAAESAPVKQKAEKSVESACDIDRLVQRLSPEQARAIQQRALENFRSGDLRRITSADSSAIAAVAERNQQWLPVITRALDRGAFVAIGAGHLGGRKGILNLLASEGYIGYQLP